MFDGVEAMSERDSVFPKFRPVLQGMNLEHVPTGGFSSPVSFVVGAEDYNYRSSNPTYFMQPGNAIKRTEINTEIPVTSGSLNSELVYKNADTKQRNPRGFMTVKRAEQEAAASTARRDAALAYKMQGGAAVPPVVPLATAQPVATGFALSPDMVSIPAPPVVYSQPQVLSPIPVVFPSQTLAGSGLNTPTTTPPSFQQFLTASKNMWNGDTSPGSYWSNNWPYIVNVILLSLLLLLLIVTIVLAAMPRHKPRRKPQQQTYIVQQPSQTSLEDAFTTFGQLY
jgi:hypothetical protein